MADADLRVAGSQGIPGIGIPPVPDGSLSDADRRRIAGFHALGADDGGGEPEPPPQQASVFMMFTRATLHPSTLFTISRVISL